MTENAKRDLSDCGVTIDEALRKVKPELFDGEYERLDRGVIPEKFASVAAYQYPLGRAPEYRGWYPIDSGSDRGKGRWCPAWSKFDGRDGQHKGADLFGSDKERLYAIVDGNAEYNVVNDPNGWGNHVYLYFKQGGTTYIAVYAHLDDSSAFTGVKRVKKGEVIGFLGCTGNAGGSCDRSHKCFEKTTLADHVHVELISVSGKSKQDPVAFFGWTPDYSSDTTCAACGKNAQLE